MTPRRVSNPAKVAGHRRSIAPPAIGLAAAALLAVAGGLIAASPVAASPVAAPPAAALPATAAPASSAAPADTAASPPAALVSRAALLVFASSRSTIALPLPPAEVRGGAAEALVDAFRERGLDLLAPAAAAELQQHWRVRSGLALDPGFLAALAAQTGARTVLVAQVIGSPEHIVLAARALDPISGAVVWADVAEAEPAGATAPTLAPGPAALPAVDQDAWRAGLRAAARRLAAGWLTPPPRQVAAPLLVLPAAGTGVDPWQADMATHCLLRDLLAKGRASILDPGVLVACLWAAGRSPAAVDAAALRQLGERFHATEALLPDLISYAPSPRHSETLAPPPDESPAAAQTAVDLAIAVRRLDTRTGLVIAAVDVFVPAPPPAGWFGRPVRPSPLAQLAEACQQLLDDPRAAPEE